MAKDTQSTAGLPITGERTVPGVPHENYWFRRHEVVYAWAEQRLRPSAGGLVLDAGGGEGYGSAMLAAGGLSPVCLDYDQSAAAHAFARYGVPSVRANLVAMPFGAASFDNVLSMQVVEHLWDQPAYVAECSRVLRSNGLFIASTPNRLTFSPRWEPGTPPTNLFHTRELAPADLVELARTQFGQVELYGVHHGPLLGALESRWNGLIDAQFASPPHLWSDDLTRDIAAIRMAEFVVAADNLEYPIESSLDLVIVGRR